MANKLVALYQKPPMDAQEINFDDFWLKKIKKKAVENQLL